MMSHEPVKRVVAALETTAPLALFCSVSARFMHLSHFRGEEQLNDSERGFCHPQPYHTILPSCNRYGKGYELIIHLR
jgi:hypothetical protein